MFIERTYLSCRITCLYWIWLHLARYHWTRSNYNVVSYRCSLENYAPHSNKHIVTNGCKSLRSQRNRFFYPLQYAVTPIMGKYYYISCNAYIISYWYILKSFINIYRTTSKNNNVLSYFAPPDRICFINASDEYLLG